MKLLNSALFFITLMILTNRFFTKSAMELAQKDGIILWDINKLRDLMRN